MVSLFYVIKRGDTMSFLKKYWEYLVIFAVLVLFAATLIIFKISCPIRTLTGISCPGCGITRAISCAVKLDIRGAFYYHPLWITIIPLIVTLKILSAKKKTKAFYAVLISFIGLLVIVWLYRMIFSDGAVVNIRLENGLIGQAVNALQGRL